MSEFSESYHLYSTNQQDGIELLQRSGFRGAVLSPADPWVTIIPDEYDQPVIEKFKANSRLPVLYYNYAEDHCWLFSLIENGQITSEYVCLWDGAEEMAERDSSFRLMGELAIKDNALNLESLKRFLTKPEHRDSLRSILYPETLDMTPAYEFCKLLGIKNYEWLSRSDLERLHEFDPQAVIMR